MLSTSNEFFALHRKIVSLQRCKLSSSLLEKLFGEVIEYVENISGHRRSFVSLTGPPSNRSRPMFEHDFIFNSEDRSSTSLARAAFNVRAIEQFDKPQKAKYSMSYLNDDSLMSVIKLASAVEPQRETKTPSDNCKYAILVLVHTTSSTKKITVGQ